MTTKSTVSILALALAVAACGSDGGATNTSAATTTTTAAAGSDLPQGGDPVQLDPADFTTEIDNPYFPLVPGTRMTYREVDGEGAVSEIILIVTTDTKEIANGITARVVRDTVTLDGAIIEDTFDWYAQDAEGNVWYLGEDTAEFENGQIVSTEGSWEAGVDGALPGIVMPADPQDGMAYRQEFYEGEAEDNAEVLSIEEQVDVAFGHFDDVVLTKDTITIEPGILEYKLYAPGVGAVLILDIAGTSGREELVSVDQAPEGAGTGPLGSPNP